MSAYVIATYNIINSKLYGEYIKNTMPILKKYEGETLVADNKNETAEGEGRDQIVIIKFPSKEKAWAWINDDEYKEVKKLRHEATKDSSMIVAKELIIPSN